MPSSALRRKVGQLFAVGFHGLTPSEEIKSLISEYGVGAVILFKRNIDDAAQLQALTLALQQEARNAGHKHPLFIAIDQENGLVTRISPPLAAQQPGSMTLGATGSTDSAYAVGKATGETLDFFGINMNYAPDCDINSEPLNPVIGVRSPGDDPDFVGRFTSAIAKGLRESHIVPSVKHFPGHGDTAVDSHYGLPVITKTRDELEKCELVPFRRAVAEGIEAVMTAHISLPSIGDGKLPATLSPDALNILREDMKYDGMVITDCLEMDAIRATYGTVEGAMLALKAGSDSIMICHTYDVQVAAIDRVCQAVESGEISLERIDESLRRVTALKKRVLSWERALHHKGEEELIKLNEKNAKLAQDVYARSTTVVRNKPGILPLSPTSKIVFLSPGGKIPAGGAVDSGIIELKNGHKPVQFIDVLRAHNESAIELRYQDGGLSPEEWKVINDAEVVILATRNAREAPYQRNLGLELARRKKNLIVITTCNPYDFLDDAEVETYIAIYEPTIEAFTAAVNVVFGRASAEGKLPVGSTASKKNASVDVNVRCYDPTRDLDGVIKVWNSALPTYALSASRLKGLLNMPNGHHLVAKTETEIVGFCLAYTAVNQGKILAQIAVLAVDPARQGQGIGTSLLKEARGYFRQHQGLVRASLGSYFPRFWPGLPTDLPSHLAEFFVHRGFRLSPPDETSADLYQDIRNFQALQVYLDRAAKGGYTFRAVQPEDFEGCLIGQKRNFCTYTGWVEAYIALNPREHPSSIMAAFDATGKQVAWTLMLSHESPFLHAQWALPPLCGPKTGLIGCVGVDAAHRKAGIGLALLCHAIEDLKRRGVEGVFVDWTTKVEWYAKVGFKVWREYRRGEI
ncbi:hypothetical protein VTN77DRAFT_1875 [Rasamsonia byssochlamydoides]|uniref:uncharacterized protein n=1 Tax=Rasamsonia byssochlamydoides TaxID=89139 RepID=UPI0037437AE3